MDANDIPIDIHCNKLVDWLIDRRHCNIKWSVATEIIKEKIVNALRDMPGTPEMVQLVQGSCFHYFKCKQIVDLLKDTERDSKNIFGRYSSQRMKDWLEILKLYERENMFLAELSNRFIRNLNYEIPSIKKQISKCEQVQDDTVSKEKDCDKNINDVQRKYKDECKKMGIVGDDVKRELLQLVVNLPDEFNEIAKRISELKNTINFYEAFTSFSIGGDDKIDVCPLLKFVITNGNMTVYQWKTGKVPLKVVKSSENDETTVDQSGGEGDIDWGGEIDFGADLQTSEFDIEEDGAGDNGFEIVDPTDEIVGDQISWDIEEITLEEIPNGAKIHPPDEEIATGENALSILEFITTRNQIINELLELQGFLIQRVVESKLDADFLSISQFQFAPPEVQMSGSDDIYKMQAVVNAIHSSLTNSRMRDLCKISDSPKYVDRLSENLKHQLLLVDKYNKIKLQCAVHRDNAAEDAKKLKPILENLISETKVWRGLLENEISKFYKNRKINLVGSINTL